MNWQDLIAQIEQATENHQWQRLAEMDDTCRLAMQSLTANDGELPLSVEQVQLLQIRYQQAVTVLQQEQQELQRQLQAIAVGRKASSAYLTGF